jgi:hypothetical protein
VHLSLEITSLVIERLVVRSSAQSASLNAYKSNKLPLNVMPPSWFLLDREVYYVYQVIKKLWSSSREQR